MPNAQILFEKFNEETQRYETVELPAKWDVCSSCRGRKTTSNHLGAFTQHEMDELGEDFKDDYRAGLYDKPCPVCAGEGLISIVDEDLCDPTLFQEYNYQLLQEQEMKMAEYEEQRMLSLMSGGSLRDW